jgi:hypothetical protein
MAFKFYGGFVGIFVVIKGIFQIFNVKRFFFSILGLVGL